MSINPFQGRAAGEGAPYDNALTITPSDTLDLPVIPSALHIPLVMKPGNDGVLQDPSSIQRLCLVMQNGEEITLASAGWTGGFEPVFLPVRPKRIKATGTTAIAVTLLW